MKYLIYSLLVLSFVTSDISDTFTTSYSGNTAAAVTLVGGVIKTSHKDTVAKKYKRKDCPVCKGQGWYISGDKITKVNCGYCEPDTKQESVKPIVNAPAYKPAPPPAQSKIITEECEDCQKILPFTIRKR